MTKEEKTKQSYQRILIAAVNEFGIENYDNASLTALCNKNNIPKGLLYHHFKSKDELYLKCVEICFSKLNDYTSNIDFNADNIKENINLFLSKRKNFFKENPYYANIFFNAGVHPPTHLKKEIREIKQEFDINSSDCYEKILSKAKLREGITLSLAVEYFVTFQEMFNTYFESKIAYENDFHNIVKEHELNLSKILDIILYGIAEEKD